MYVGLYVNMHVCTQACICVYNCEAGEFPPVISPDELPGNFPLGQLPQSSSTVSIRVSVVIRPWRQPTSHWLGEN